MVGRGVDGLLGDTGCMCGHAAPGVEKGMS